MDRQAVDETIARVRRAAHERFMTQPGTSAHRDAIRAEVELDRELDDVLREARLDEVPVAGASRAGD